jgi:hypothetical protein
MVSLVHQKVSAVADGGDTTFVRPSDWNAEHTLSLSATDRLLGRSTAGAGAAEEITCTAFARSILDDANEAAFKATVNLEIGVDVQAYDADLTTWAGLTPSANAQSLVTAADYAAMKALLDLEIGVDVQAYDADLTTWAGVTPGTGVATALAVAVGSAGAFVTFNGAGGTPSSLTLTNASGLPLSGVTDSTSEALGVGTLEIGHATDTTLARVSAGVASIEGSNILLASGLGSITQAYDVDTLKADLADVLTAGFAQTPYSAGTKSSGTYTPDEALGNLQYATNNGAHTLAPPTNNGTLIILYANGASAGTITTSGFTKVTGDAFTTTNGHEFLCYITKHNNGVAFSHLHVTALQ